MLPTHFLCQRPHCRHSCDIINDGVGPFCSLFIKNTSNSYAIVKCPKCNTSLYHCRLCMYNTPIKCNIKRHSHVKPVFTSAVEASSNNSDDDVVDMDVSDDGSFGVAINDDASDGGGSCCSDDDDDIMEISDDELEDLPPDDTVIIPPPDQDNVDQDGLLCSLVAEELDDANINDSSMLLFDYDRLNPFGLRPIDSFRMFGDNLKSKLFYWQNDVHRKLTNGKNRLGGLMGITWRAINQICSFGSNDIASLPDTKLMFNMLDHALANKGGQQRNFFDILSNVCSRIPTSITTFIASLGKDAKDQFDAFSNSLNSDQKHAFNNLCNISGKSTLEKRLSTRDDGAANAMLLKGQYSMLKGLPAPKVHIEEESGHAYVLISDVIDHAVADGLGILQLQDQYGKRNCHAINGSPAAEELLQDLRAGVSNPDETAFGALVLWSDGFCRTYVKQKDNSVWILTLTFLNTDKKTKSPMHTYCIAIGKSSEDHTPVLEIIMKQLEDIRQAKTRYCGITGTFIKTSFGVIAYSTDRIERCSILHTSQLGTFGQRSHWACAINPHRLPMCAHCFHRLISTLETSLYPQLEVLDENICQECCQWDFDNAIGPLPDDYPTTSSDDDGPSPTPPENRTADEVQHIPMLQTFGWLEQGLLYAFHNATISDRSQRWLKQQIEPYLKSMGMNQKVINGLWKSVVHKRKNPNADTLPFVPYLWKVQHVLPMEKFINSPMHLLFHGVVDDVMKLVHKFMSKYNKLETFERFVNEYLLEIEMFRLDWCKLRKLPKAFWLAEDILGFCRIMPCIYGMFFANNFKFGTHAQSSQFVKSCKSVQRLLNSLHVMISCLMNPCTATDVKKIDTYIKLYLSCGHDASKCIDGKGELFWMDRGNHLSLLNLPAQIARFGPVRWYWEGVSEAFIQEIKPYLIASMRKSGTYFRDKLTLVYKLRAMAFMKRQIEDSDGGEDVEEKSRDGKGFYRYASLADIEESFQSGKPISTFVFKDDFIPQDKCLVWAAFGRGSTTQIVPIQYYATNSVELCGIAYFDCNLLTNNIFPAAFDSVRDKVSSYSILLPNVKDHANRETQLFNRKYAMVFDDWTVLSSRIGTKEEVYLSHKLFL